MSRLARWVWSGESIGARALRLGLMPPALGVQALTALRASAYRRGLLSTNALPLPTVSVGNLTVGGTGKTPIASWIAGYYASLDMKPGILLRGYGGDEGQVHREAVPQAIVVEDPDRLRGARRALARGARVLVLDDAFQRLDVRREVDLVLVAAESAVGAPRTLPAGPWRERPDALRRATHIVVTRKRATREEASRVAAGLAGTAATGCPIAIAELHLSSFRGLLSGSPMPISVVRDARVLAIAGVADPTSFGSQLAGLNAKVELQDWPDHHAFTARDVGRILQAASQADWVVMTAKDAVKLRELWPVNAAEPLVAHIGVRWEHNGSQIQRALHDLTIHFGGSR